MVATSKLENFYFASKFWASWRPFCMEASFFLLVAAASISLRASLMRSWVVYSTFWYVRIGGIHKDLKLNALATELTPWCLVVLCLRAIKTILIATPMQNKCLVCLISSLDLLFQFSLLLTKPLVRSSVELALIAVIRISVVEHHWLSGTRLNRHLIAGPPLILLRRAALKHHISTTFSIVGIFLIFALLIFIIWFMG